MKKRYFFIILVTLFLSLKVNSQIETRLFPKHESLLGKLEKYSISIDTKNTKQLPTFDLRELQKEDKELEECDIPFRFGNAFDVNYKLSDGEWHNVKGGRCWTLKIQSYGAQSLNFILANLNIPEGGKLFVVGNDSPILYGPVDDKNVGKKGILMTDIIPGSTATICLYEPNYQRGKSSLTVKRVVHGYRSFQIDEYLGLIGTSAPCNIDIACYPAFEDESKAVGLVLLSTGNELCSGALIMSTDASLKPYFLTAFHCIDSSMDGSLSYSEILNAENWMFKFWHKRTGCDGSISTGYTYNGDTFRAGWYSTDFALVELNTDLTNNPNLNWLGWDRTGITPTSGYCIHHPCGDLMKINIMATPFGISSWNGINNHWYANWSEGITQGGSSGAPFLNQDKLIIGQNHGKLDNQSYLPLCDRKRSDAGMFHLSWDGGGTNNTRLSNWLDPNNVGCFSIQSKHNYEIEIIGNSRIFDSSNYCTSISPNCYYDISWSLTGTNASNFTIQQDSLNANSCIITRKTNGQYTGSDTLVLKAELKRNNNLIFSTYKSISAPYINGPAVPCNYSTYEVNPLQSNQTVEWSFSGTGVDNLVLPNRSFNVPENACGIINTDHHVIRGTLTATVKNGGNVVGTLQRRIGTGANFTGTWYQEPGLLIDDTLNVTPKEFNDNDWLTVKTGRKIYMQSNGFIGATISYISNGISPFQWNNSNGVISFRPTLGLGATNGNMTINGTKGTCEQFTLHLTTPLDIIDDPIGPLFSVSSKGSEYTFSIDYKNVAERKAEPSWNVSVVQYETNKNIYECVTTGNSVTVNTAGWKSGIYFVRAIVGDQSSTQKIVIGK